MIVTYEIKEFSRELGLEFKTFLLRDCPHF